MVKQLFIRCLTGESYTVVNPFQLGTVLNLKKHIEKTHGYLVRHQRLIYCGREMQNDRQIASYSVATDTSLHMVILDDPVDHAIDMKAANYIRNAATWVRDCLLHQYDVETSVPCQLPDCEVEKLSESLRNSVQAVSDLVSATRQAHAKLHSCQLRFCQLP